METINNVINICGSLLGKFWKLVTIFRSTNKDDNITAVVFRLMAGYKVKVTYASVIEYLKSHPDFPSLKIICDFFDEISIPNYALKIDESDLYKLERPFIAHISEKGGKVLLVYAIDKEQVIYADSFYGRKTISVTGFLEKWNGVVILIEPDESSGETGYSEKRKKEIIRNSLVPFIVFLFFLTCFIAVVLNTSFQDVIPGPFFLLIGLTHLAGLIFSLMLFRHELEIKTKFTDKLCHLSSGTDCNAVTKSKASKIFGSITWADAGVAYFSGGLAALFIFPVGYSTGLLTALSLTALPYSVFSILYQWIKLKKWCPLCLSVQFIVITEFIITAFNLNLTYFRPSVFVPAFLVYSIIFLTLILMKLLIVYEKEKDHFTLELIKFKREPELFNYRLRLGERIDIQTDRSALILGDMQSKVTISVFLSLYCSACARKFNDILNLIRKNGKVKVQLIYSKGRDEMSVKLMKVIWSLMNKGDNDKILEILTGWYNTDIKSRSELLKIYNIPEISDDFENMIKYNTELFKSAKMTHVPAIYVNGYPLPRFYSVEDIKYHVTGLAKMKNQPVKIEI